MDVKVVMGCMDASAQSVAIVVSRWNELVTKQLLEGALQELERLGCKKVEVIHVPGTWEMPVAVKALLERAETRPDAVVTLGCILQGETPHANLLSSDVASALMGLQVLYGTPVAWGVLTPNNADQAMDRAGLKHGNKGREAVQAAVEMVSVINSVRDKTA